MSADDLDPNLDGLLDGLNTPPAKKAAAKKAVAKKAAAPESVSTEPEDEPEQQIEQPIEDPIAQDSQIADERAELELALRQYKDLTAASRPNGLEEIKAQLRAEIMAEVLAEFKAERSAQQVKNTQDTVRAIDATHKGTSQDDTNWLAIPSAPDDLQLPPLIHFVEDGFTINSTRAFRGQEYEPTRQDAWAALTPNEQVRAYGKVMFRVGPWEGATFDLDDPALTNADRERLAAIAQDRYANRLRVAPLADVGSGRY